MSSAYAKYSGLGSNSNVVTSLNSLVGDVVLAAGANVTITPSGNTLTIASSGGGGGGIDTIGTIDGNGAAADGLSISGSSLFAQSASATNPGLVNNATQSFSGDKTFTGVLAASNLSGTNTGDVSIGTASGLSLAGQVLSLGVASAGVTGALSGTDWSTFNGKQAALSIGNLTDVGTDGIVVTGGTGAVIGSGTSIAQHVADTSHNGYLSSADWNTFSAKQNAITTGNLTDVGTDGIVITGGTGVVIGSGTSIAQHVADTTHNGYLSSTDWNTFNSKGSGTVTAVSVASSNGFTGTSSGGATPALTLATSVTGILKGNGTAISAATAPDFPTLNQNTTGTAGGLSATLVPASGGTGLASLTPYAVLTAGTTNTGTFQQVSGVGTSGQVLTSNGAAALPTWQAASGGNVPDSFINDVALSTSVQRMGGQADTILDAYYTGFTSAVTQQVHYLLDAYSSGGTTNAMKLACNAIAPADTYTNATTGWSTAGNAGTLTTSVTVKVGATSVSFNKTSGGTTAYLTRTPTAKSLANNTYFMGWLNMPSITNFTNFFIRIGTDSSNYKEWDITTVEGGGSIASGWNFLVQDISTGGSTVGTGWTTATVPTFFAAGITAGSTQTYTAVLMNGFMFGDTSSPATGVQLGDELTLYNTSTKDTFIVDSSNARINGTITVSSMSNSYAATNTATFVQRSTMSIGANNFFGQIPQSNYGGTTAEERVILPLQTAASNSNIIGMADLNQGYFYPVTTVNTNTSIVVNAGADIHTFYQSGCTFYAFQPVGDSNGNITYKKRSGSYTSSGAASNSAGLITIPTASTSSISVGDYILKECIDLQLSTTSSGVNESYSSMSLQNIQVINPLVAIPDTAHLYGYYNLSGATGANNSIANTSGSNGSLTGSLTTTNAYFNGHFATSGFLNATNYYSIPNAQGLSGASADTTSMAVSVWFNTTQGGTQKVIFAADGNTNNGHFLMVGSANNVGIFHSTNILDIGATSSQWTANAWTHIYYYIDNTPTQKLWVNGVFIGSSSTSYTSPGAISATIGITGTLTNAMNVGEIADLVIWRGNAVATSAQILALYNNGIPPLLAGANTFRHSYLNTAVTASQLEIKALVTQVTSGETTNMRQFAVGRRS